MIARADALGFVIVQRAARPRQKGHMDHWHVGIVHRCRLRRRDRRPVWSASPWKTAASAELAQSMDEMTSQNSVMGYKAAIVAANAYGSFLPMMTTAAGTIRPAKVLIRAPASPACRPSAPPSVSALSSPRTTCVRHPRAKSNPSGAKFLDLGLDFSKGRAKAVTPRAERRRAGPAAGRGRSEGRRLRHRHHHRQSAGPQASRSF